MASTLSSVAAWLWVMMVQLSMFALLGTDSKVKWKPNKKLNRRAKLHLAHPLCMFPCNGLLFWLPLLGISPTKKSQEESCGG